MAALEDEDFGAEEDELTELLDLALLLDPSAGSGTFEELLDCGVTLEEVCAEQL